MIKLEDVSIQLFETMLKKRLEKEETFEEILNAISILKNYSIENYEQLKELIKSSNPDFNMELLKKELECIEAKIEFANSQGTEPEIYSSNGYKLGVIDLRSLGITDKYTSGRNLILKSPTNIRHTNRDGYINMHTIGELKHMLTHVHPNLKNVLLYGNYSLTREDIPKLIKAINFYEEQVIRQAQEIKKDKSIHLPRNVFEYDKDIKRELVEEQIKDVVDYLTSSTSTYIWGKLTEAEKLRLIKSVTSRSGNQIIKRNIVEMIANYTTLSEIEEGLKPKTLKRFIVR